MNPRCRYCRQLIELKGSAGWVHTGDPWYVMCGSYIDDEGNEIGGRVPVPSAHPTGVST